MKRHLVLCTFLAAASIAGAVFVTAVGRTSWTTEGIRLDDNFSSYEVADEHTLVVHFLSGDESCWRNVEVSATESADVVVVKASQQRRTGDGWCTLSALIHAEPIRLDAPLGDRAVIDGTTGNPIAQRV